MFIAHSFIIYKYILNLEKMFAKPVLLCTRHVCTFPFEKKKTRLSRARQCIFGMPVPVAVCIISMDVRNDFQVPNFRSQHFTDFCAGSRTVIM